MYHNVGIEPLAYTIFEFNGDKMSPPEQVGWLGKDLDEHHIMQFTGMYDRNDNEIWEGDVLNQYNSYDKNTAKIIGTRQVKWDDIANCGCCGQIRAMGFDIESDPRLVEVIGNIYENSELA